MNEIVVVKVARAIANVGLHGMPFEDCVTTAKAAIAAYEEARALPCEQELSGLLYKTMVDWGGVNCPDKNGLAAAMAHEVIKLLAPQPTDEHTHTQKGESDMETMTRDKREILAVWDAHIEDGLGFRVGFNNVTKIQVYEETGHMAPIPWIAIYVNDELIYRVPTNNLIIEYYAAPQKAGADE